MLYFSSDRPGGFGDSDLYVASINEDGSIGQAKNLGKEINTGGKETFPFVSAENELYFSSDGHFGLGGLDVFYVKIKDKAFGNLLNIGEPVNSSADDFAFGINDTTKRGFISSNRSQTEGKFVYDNIYSFVETTPIQDPYLANIDGYVTDKQTGKPLQNTSITLTDSKGEIYAQLRTDDKGYYQIETNKIETYFIKAEKEGYDTDEKVSKPNLETQQIDFQLQQNKVNIEPGTDLSKVLNIPIIYFDFDKWNIRPDAQVELEKVFAALKEYPQLKLNIRSHTDSRGNDAYNKALSIRRAKSTLDYLVSKGIDSSRLKSEGLGESELVNNCANGIPCSVKEHQKNRRSEFIVIK
jgi:outer membrane protein OmpA-like peptidoglycan-associated protein